MLAMCSLSSSFWCPTTGFTCTAVVNLVLEKKYNKIGISPPEFLGKHYNEVNEYLKERDVIYKMKKEIL